MTRRSLDEGPMHVEAADYWAMRMVDAEAPITDEEQIAFHDWLLATEENQRDYLRATVLLQIASELPDADRNTLMAYVTDDAGSESARIASRRNIFKYAGLAAAAAVALVTGGLYLENRGLFGETHSTRTGETRTVKFSDGSVAYLNTRTELRWLGSDNDRRVELVNGEALFDVVHDEAHPFSVKLDDSEIRVLGTRFNVYRKDSGDVVVTVLEGGVEVRGFARGTARPQWVRRVFANQQIEYRPIGIVDEPHYTDPQLAVNWRAGILQIPEGQLLSEVLDEAARYTDKRIIIRDPRVAEVKIGGSFSTRDVRYVLSRIEAVAPISVHETDNAYIVDFRLAGTPGNAVP